MHVNIRQETPKDYQIVEKVVESAFRNEEFSDQTEHILVSNLRKSSAFISELSIVAELDDKIVGHILVTRININDTHNSFESLALAPVSVDPNYQSRGIGGQLIIAAHNKAKALGYKSIILVGHADYYPRFGYRKLSTYNISLPFSAPDENCLAIELTKGALKKINGQVKYDDAFGRFE